jgi:DNA modification methylase
MQTTVNPFFAATSKPSANPVPADAQQPVWVKLPQAPINASPVPHLTSLYHFDQDGDYGDRRYPGNCGGNLIKDLLQFFKPHRVFDPMSGSGTCRDVCRELNIKCTSGDIHHGFDLCELNEFSGENARFDRDSFDFVWIHPPYWRQKLYADDPRDLSRCPTLDAFLERYLLALEHCAYVLKPGGILAVLMGDYIDRDAGFIPLTYHTKRLAIECGMRQSGVDIIRFLHGASSSRKVYHSSFIPMLHDVCMFFQK